MPRVDAVVSGGLGRGAGQAGVLDLLGGKPWQGSSHLRWEEDAVVLGGVPGTGTPECGASDELRLQEGLRCNSVGSIHEGLNGNPAVGALHPLVRSAPPAAEGALHPNS